MLVCTRGRCIWNCNRYLNDRGQRDGHLSLVASRPRQRVFLSIHPFLCRLGGTPCRHLLRARRLHRSRAPHPTQRPPAHITDPDPDTHSMPHKKAHAKRDRRTGRARRPQTPPLVSLSRSRHSLAARSRGTRHTSPTRSHRSHMRGSRAGSTPLSLKTRHSHTECTPSTKGTLTQPWPLSWRRSHRGPHACRRAARA